MKGGVLRVLPFYVLLQLRRTLISNPRHVHCRHPVGMGFSMSVVIAECDQAQGQECRCNRRNSVATAPESMIVAINLVVSVRPECRHVHPSLKHIPIAPVVGVGK